MKPIGRYISPEGRIALPLILLASLCFLDQTFNAVDYMRLSWLVCLILSFPTGWLFAWIARAGTQMVSPSGGIAANLMVFVAGSAGSALNIYGFAGFITWLWRQRDTGNSTTIDQDEFKRLIDEHRKGRVEPTNGGNR
jgi:hypothetical protein